MNTKKLTMLSLLSAIALTIFMVEAQLPGLVPIPGIKLGLSNIVTVFAVFTLGPWEALAVLLVRIVLGSIFAGQMMCLFYSLAGGLLSIGVTILLRRVLRAQQLWVAGCLGGLAHNLGQLLVAIAITSTPVLGYYFPVLAISGMLTGLFTGLCAQFLVHRLDKKQLRRPKT